MFPFSSLDPSVKPMIDCSFFVTLKFALVGMWIVNFLSRFRCGVMWSGLMFFFFIIPSSVLSIFCMIGMIFDFLMLSVGDSQCPSAFRMIALCRHVILIWCSIARRSLRIFWAHFGVLFIAPRYVLETKFCSGSSFFFCFLESDVPQTIEPYVRVGRIIVLYSHNILSLSSPHFFPIAALHAKNRFLHFMILFEICSSHFNWSSIVMPRYFVLWDSSLVCWLILICFGFSLWFEVQHMIWVLGALISSPWLEHHSDTIFTCFSVVSMTVAMSFPAWSMSRSSAYAKIFLNVSFLARRL